MRKNRIDSHRRTLFSRALCLFLAVSLLMPASFPSASAQTPAELPGVPGGFSSSASVTLPSSLGKIEDRFQGGEKTVVLIRDAHAIPGAQRSIYEIITYFQKQYGVPVVAVEGAAAQMDFNIFKSFPDKKILRQTFDEYFESGELPGTVAASILGGADGAYLGIEEWEVYEEGVGLYLSALDREPELLGRLSAAEKNLQERKEKIYSPRLLEIDRTLAGFEENKESLLGVLKVLAAVQRPEAETELAIMLEEAEKDQSGSSGIEAELKDAAKKTEAHLRKLKSSPENKAKIREFSVKTQEYRTSKITSEAFALFRSETAQTESLDLVFSDKLNSAKQKQKTIRDLEGTRFFEAFENYAASVKASLFRTPEERELDEYGAYLGLMKKLAKMELNQKDWAALRSAEAWPEGESLDQSFNAHTAFYENAEKRDGIFADRLSGILESADTSSAILVAGGFHTEGLIRRFKEEGVSYILVMPAIKALPEENNYRGHMKGNVSWKDYFRVENGRINIYDAFVRGVRDRLLSNAKNPSGEPSDAPVLKEWRDQLIRDLAKEGRIASAGEYTFFLDEAAQGEETDNLGGDRLKVRRFIEGLREMSVKGRFDESSIAGLLQPATIPEPYSVPTPGATVSFSNLRSELRTPPAGGDEEGDNLPVRREESRALIPQDQPSLFPANLAIPAAAPPAGGMLARAQRALQLRSQAAAIKRAKARIDRSDVDYRWMPNQFFRALAREGLEVLIPAADYAFEKGPSEAKAVFIFALFSRRESPSGIHPYLLETLDKITLEDLAAALRIPDSDDEVVEHLLSFRHSGIDDMIVALFDHPQVGSTVNVKLIEAAKKHVGNAEVLLERASRLSTTSLSETLAEFKASKLTGLHARHRRPTLAEALEMGSMDFESLVVPDAEDTILIIKGETDFVMTLFPGVNFNERSLHNHPGDSIFPSGYAVRRGGQYGSEEYGRGDLFHTGTRREHYIFSGRGITQYYQDPGYSGALRPHVISVRFADGQTVEVEAKEVRTGRFLFDDKSPLLFDEKGNPRSFVAQGMLGPNGKAFGMTFVTWPQLIRRFARGDAGNLAKFLSSRFVDLTRLNPGDAEKIAAWMRDKKFPLTSLEEASLREMERSAAPAPSAGDSKALVSVAAEQALQAQMGERLAGVVQIASPSLRSLFGQTGLLFTTENQLENFLPVAFSEDYAAAAALARLMIDPSRPLTVRSAAFRGIAASAAYLTPEDTREFLRNGLAETDARVKNAALDLLFQARADTNVLPFFQQVLREGFEMRRVLSQTGPSNLPDEQKKALFLLYVSSNEAYRAFLAEDFSRDLFGYAPKTVFFSLARSGLSSADKTDVLIQIYTSLGRFEASGLTVSYMGQRPFILETMNLEDADILRLIPAADGKNDVTTSEVLREMLKDRSRVPPMPPAVESQRRGRAAAGAQTPETPAEPKIGAQVDAAAASERRRMLDGWLTDALARYPRTSRNFNDVRYAIFEDLIEIFKGLSRWDLGLEFNTAWVGRLIGPAGIPVNGDDYSRIANGLTAVPLAPETALGFYQRLAAGGMEFFRDKFEGASGDTLLERLIASPYLQGPQRRVLLDAALADPKLTDDQYGADIRGRWSGEEANLYAFLKALIASRFSVAEDMSYITRFPMFTGSEVLHAILVMQARSSGRAIQAPDIVSLSQSVRTRFPNAVAALNQYVGQKRDQILAGEIPEDPAFSSGSLEGPAAVPSSGTPALSSVDAPPAAVPSSGTPGLPPADARSELRSVAEAVVAELIDGTGIDAGVIPLVARAGAEIVPVIEAAAELALARKGAERAIERDAFEGRFRALFSSFNKEPVYIRHVVSAAELGLMADKTQELKVLLETIQSTVKQYEKVAVEVQFADGSYREALKGIDLPDFDKVKFTDSKADNRVVFYNEAYSNYSAAAQTPFVIGLSGELLTDQYGEEQAGVTYPQASNIASGFFLAGLAISAARLSKQPLDDIVVKTGEGRYRARTQAVLEGFTGLARSLAADHEEFLAAARSA